jgi:hypothetical protein
VVESEFGLLRMGCQLSVVSYQEKRVKSYQLAVIRQATRGLTVIRWQLSGKRQKELLFSVIRELTTVN